ncbi:hypothetical protein Tco_0917722 [Tanacetum coccineum]
MPTVGSSPVAATRQPTSPSPQPTSTSAHSTGPPTNQPTNHSTLQPTPFSPTNPTPTTNLPPTNSIPPTPSPVPSLATTQPNRNPASTHSMARLVANGSTQLTSIDVDETFIPIVKPVTIRTQPPGFQDSQHPDHVCVTPSNLSSQRNVEYPRALLYESIAQDLRTAIKRVV